MSANKDHDLTSFLISASETLEREYYRIRARTLEDPGTAGDQGEENWAELLREWLPQNYHVVTKGRLLDTRGNAGPQVDVLVLHPSYPKVLHNKKLYLADGVVAAFECKTTLRKGHIIKAMQSSKAMKQLTSKRGGTPYKELSSGLLYGLLAHSHDLSSKSTSEKSLSILASTLAKADSGYVDHPRWALDFLCVADLGTFTYSKSSMIPLAKFPQYEGSQLLAEMSPVSAQYIEQSARINVKKPSFTPIGVLLSSLMRSLAWEDVTLRRIAEYFRYTVPQTGVGATKTWDESVFSDKVLAQYKLAEYSDEHYDEWGVIL